VADPANALRKAGTSPDLLRDSSQDQPPLPFKRPVPGRRKGSEYPSFTSGTALAGRTMLVYNISMIRLRQITEIARGTPSRGFAQSAQNLGLNALGTPQNPAKNCAREILQPSFQGTALNSFPQ